jgi:hypothetical protein
MKLKRAKREYTAREMRRALVVGWGRLGARVADCWLGFNRAYFGGRLRPLPIFLTPVSPYGHWVGLTCCGVVTHIALTAPKQGDLLVAKRGTLLHEMIHQLLFETNEETGHDGEPWRREIMRLHKEITGKEIWAGAYTVFKGKDRKSVRGNKPHPETGAPSLTQGAIARWPHSVGIDLGAL